MIEEYFEFRKSEHAIQREAITRYRFMRDVIDLLEHTLTLRPPRPHQASSHDGRTIPIPSLASSGLPPLDRYLTVELPAITLPIKTPSGKLN